MAMMLSRRRSGEGSRMVMPPREAADENTEMIGFDVHDVVVFSHRPVRSEYAVLAIMHRLFLAQPVEIRPEGIGVKQIRIAGMEFG